MREIQRYVLFVMPQRYGNLMNVRKVCAVE